MPSGRTMARQFAPVDNWWVTNSNMPPSGRHAGHLWSRVPKLSRVRLPPVALMRQICPLAVGPGMYW